MNPPVEIKDPAKYVGKSRKVLPGMIYSPSHFYLIKKSNLKEILKFHWQIKETVEYSHPSVIIGPFQGEACAVKVQNTWLRGNVLQCRPRLRHVQLLDVGGNAWLAADDVKNLPASLAKIPGKAFRAHIPDIVPREDGPWSIEAIHYFEGIITSGALKMKGLTDFSANRIKSLGVELTYPRDPINIKQSLLHRQTATNGRPSENLIQDIPLTDYTIPLTLPELLIHM